MNSPIALVPVLPESAPFTPEQRAYLNGFLAGLFSYAPAGGTGAASNPVPAPPRLQSLTILFGSQTGTAEKLARRIAKEAGKRGFAPTIHDLGTYPLASLATEPNLLLITSTYGDGEPPDNARTFGAALNAEAAPRLAGVRFSVCGLGDTNYPKFCGFAREVDARLEQLGATRVAARAECDVDYESAFATWLGQALAAFGVSAPPATAEVTTGGSTGAGNVEAEAEVEATGYDRQNPFPAQLVTNRRLNAAGSEKDVRHFELSLAGSNLSYEVGDALGVVPRNDPHLVEEILRALRATGDELVAAPNARSLPAREALLGHYEITRIPSALLQWMARRTGDSVLTRVAAPEANGELTQFLRGREIIDLLTAFPESGLTLVELLPLLRKIQPRLYSISSSLKAHPDQVHLTVGTVRYESLGRRRQGVCSTFLADRTGTTTPVPVFVHHNGAFRPPPADRAMIMVGPGTGIAPFRAFLQERRVTGATGRNWLFFGDQRAGSDFLYQDELTSFQSDGLLQRLDLAWSRDQGQKVYVQDRMKSAATELWSWLEAGAAFYVCGDASRMARDVETALLEIIQTAGGRTPDQAREYLQSMKSGRRYQRDVY